MNLGLGLGDHIDNLRIGYCLALYDDGPIQMLTALDGHMHAGFCGIFLQSLKNIFCCFGAGVRADLRTQNLSDLHAKRLSAQIGCSVTQLFLDAKELVILGHTVASAGRSGLDLTGIDRHSKVCNGGVLCLTGAV